MFIRTRFGLYTFTFTIIFSLLACGQPLSFSGSDPTKVAMEVQLTMQAIQNATLAAQAAQGGQPLQGAQPLPTYTPFPTYTPVQIIPPSIPTEAPATPTKSLAERMASANILVLEDVYTSELGPWVKDALDMMGVDYRYVGTNIGDFMSELNSGTTWDLIIVAAENRSGVQGEFWDIIGPKVIQDKTALIVEMWYLSTTANGRIKSLTSQCGIEFQKIRTRVDSIYTLDSQSPIFTTPNSGFSLVHYSKYWDDKGGDYIRLTAGSEATLLAGGFSNEKSSYGLIATCFDGRVIFQTFSNHDYKKSDIQMLWQNYVTNTLQKHFEVIP